MPIQQLIDQLANVTTSVSLVAIAIFALTWAVGSLLKGAPIPIRSLKMAGQSMIEDAIRGAFMLSIWSAVSALIAWLVVAIASAG